MNLKRIKMNLAKVINALHSTNKIKEGLFNKFFKKDEVEQIASVRMNICNSCDKLDKLGKDCLAPGTQPCCSECGCSLALKTRSLSSECPIGRWLAVIDKIE